MGQVRTKPIIVHAALVKRGNGAVATRRTFKGRIPLQLYLKIAAWLYSNSDEYPPEKFMLVVHVEPDHDERAKKLMELLRRNGVTLAGDIYGLVGKPS